jgi:hypothetical protein
MRAKELKSLELALSQVFLGLDENPTDPMPMLDKTHKKQEYSQLEGHNSKAPGYATTIKAYIQHVFKENSKIWENNSNRFTRII